MTDFTGAGGSIFNAGVLKTTTQRTTATPATVVVKPVDPSFRNTGIPTSYYDEKRVAANWYWQGNQVQPCTPRMVLTPNDDRGTAERTAGSSAVVLAGSRILWEEYSGGTAVVNSRLFMKPLYTYCQQRLAGLLRHRATAEASLDGGWAWTLECARLCDAAMRATNVSPALLFAMIWRRRPNLGVPGREVSAQVAFEKMLPELRNSAIADYAYVLATKVPHLAYFDPYMAMQPVGQADIVQQIQYMRRPEKRLAEPATFPEDAYGDVISWRFGPNPDATRQRFVTHRGQWWIGDPPPPAPWSEGLGPAAMMGSVESMAKLIQTSSYEAWTAEALTVYVLAILAGDMPPNVAWQPGRPFVSAEDLNALHSGQKKMNREMALGAAIAVGGVFVGVVKLDFKQVAAAAVQLFTILLTEMPPNVVTLVNFLDTPFRRVLAEPGWSTAPYPGDTATVTNRIFSNIQRLAEAIAEAKGPGVTEKTVWNPAHVDWLHQVEATPKKPFLSPGGVVALAVLSVVGIAYWKTR